MSSGKLPPHEVWDALERMALEDEAERVAGLSDAEVDAELGAKGVDPKALRARGEALVAKLEAAKAKGTGVVVAPLEGRGDEASRRAARRWRVATWAAAAALAAGIALVILKNLGGEEPIVAHPPPSPAELAATLRREAFSACDAKRWVECRGKLDDAARLDPAGEKDPRVAAARQAADSALEAGPPAPR